MTTVFIVVGIVGFVGGCCVGIVLNSIRIAKIVFRVDHLEKANDVMSRRIDFLEHRP